MFSFWIEVSRINILVGCAQAAVVGYLMEVVGLLFFMRSYVCQVADPSSTPNAKGLLLIGLACWIVVFWMALGARFEKNDILEPFASPGPPAQENLALLMAISSQRREKAGKGCREPVRKATKKKPGHKKIRLLQILLSSSILKVF